MIREDLIIHLQSLEELFQGQDAVVSTLGFPKAGDGEVSETKLYLKPKQNSFHVRRKYKLRITSGGYRVLQSHQSNCFCDEESKGLIFLKLELTWQRQTNHALLSFWKPTWPNSCAELIYWELLSLQLKIVYLLSLQVKRLIVTSAWFTNPSSR